MKILICVSPWDKTQLGGFYIWTYTYQLIRTSSLKLKALEGSEEEASKSPNKSLDSTHQTQLLNESIEDAESQVSCLF